MTPSAARGSRSDEMCPGGHRRSRAQGEKRANTVFSAALEAEKVHRALYQRAKVRGCQPGRQIRPIWVCSVCGFTGEAMPPISARCATRRSGSIF